MLNKQALRASFEQEFGVYADAVDPADLDEVYESEPSAKAEVRAKNPNRSNRLPREDFMACAPYDDRAPLMERCAEVLGDRLVDKRHIGFFLDGRPTNIEKIVAAAGLQFKDEEPQFRGPAPKVRKRRKKVA